MNIIFVLWGTKYSPDQVEELYLEIKQYYPEYDYYCFTDQLMHIDGLDIIPIQKDLNLYGVWNKLYMFSSQFPLAGRTVFFDIDVVVRGDPFKNINFDWNKVNIIYNHKKDDDLIRLTNYDVKINSSVIAWNRDLHHDIWDKFENSGYRDYFLRKYKGIDRYLMHEGFYQSLNAIDESCTYSYKYDEENNAPIVTFEELDFGSSDFRQELKAH